MKVPELYGTEKQVKWAEEIRNRYLKEFDFNELENNRKQFNENNIKIKEVKELLEKTKDEKYNDEFKKIKRIQFKLMSKIRKDRLMEIFLLNEKRAAFYIETRGTTESLINKLQKKEELREFYEKEDKKRLEEENLPNAECIVFYEDDYISVKSPKHRDLINLFRKLGYSWDSDLFRWKKYIGIMTGSFEDRAAELIIGIQEEGFTVALANPNPLIDEKVKNKTFEPEYDYWICCYQEKYLKVIFPRNNTLFQELKKIKGFEYKNSMILFPFSAFDVLMDFAKENNFKITPGVYQFTGRTPEEKLSEVELYEDLRDDD